MPGEQAAYYWDACVPLAYIQDEENRAHLVQAMLDEAAEKRYELFTSVLSVTEVAFVEKENASGQLDGEVLEKIDALWQPPSPLVLVEYFPQIAAGARDLIREAVSRDWSLQPPDAIHPATARHLQVEQFHTYDDKLKRWGELLEFKVDEPHPFQIPIV